LIQHDAPPDQQEPEWLLLADKANLNDAAPVPHDLNWLQLADKLALSANLDMVDYLPPPPEVIMIDDDDDYVVPPVLPLPSPKIPKIEPDVPSVTLISSPRYPARECRAP
jgi:hypothetical protein